MFPVKSVKQSYMVNQRILELLETFRCMVNDCVQIGLREHTTSMKLLSLRAYHTLDRYPVYTGYRLTAVSKAAGLLRNYRKALRKNPNTKVPYAHKMNLVAYKGVKVKDGTLTLPVRAGEHISIPLNPHTVNALGGFRVRSVTLTAIHLSLCYERCVESIRPVGCLGVDRNLNNVTIADINGGSQRLDLSQATAVKSKYREVKRHLNRNDVRIRRRIYGKYGVKQRNKVQQILHHASKMIVQEAKKQQHAIVMEKLTGIRKLYRKGNWQSRQYRGMMNDWSFRELQRQIEYKAEWEGLPVIYMNPYGSSSKCAKCGSRLVKSRKPEERRTLNCLRCGFTVDRDVNAALNLAAGGMRFVPIASQTEAMVSVYTPPVDCEELLGGLNLT